MVGIDMSWDTKGLYVDAEPMRDTSEFEGFEV